MIKGYAHRVPGFIYFHVRCSPFFHRVTIYIFFRLAFSRGKTFEPFQWPELFLLLWLSGQMWLWFWLICFIIMFVPYTFRSLFLLFLSIIWSFYHMRMATCHARAVFLFSMFIITCGFLWVATMSNRCAAILWISGTVRNTCCSILRHFIGNLGIPLRRFRLLSPHKEFLCTSPVCSGHSFPRYFHRRHSCKVRHTKTFRHLINTITMTGHLALCYTQRLSYVSVLQKRYIDSLNPCNIVFNLFEYNRIGLIQTSISFTHVINFMTYLLIMKIYLAIVNSGVCEWPLSVWDRRIKNVEVFRSQLMWCSHPNSWHVVDKFRVDVLYYTHQ